MATERPETLTDLLRERVSGTSGPTFRAFRDRAFDPLENYRPSTHVLYALREGRSIKINPKLVRALAAGFQLPLERVQRAATNQFIVGVELVEPDVEDIPQDTAVRVANIEGEDIDPKAQAHLDRMLTEARERERQQDDTNR